jgi:hypothetical protein
LWVAIEGAHAFRKVTMSATPPVVGPLIHLPRARADAYFDAASMAVLAGTPLSVVIVLSDGGTATDVRVFDDGVPRATGATARNGSLVTAGPPGTVFGVDVEAPFIQVYTASPAGFTATTHKVLTNGAFDSLAYVSPRVFTGGGDAIDVTSPAAPSWAGRLPYQGTVARRDAVSVMMLAITSAGFPSVQRADLRIFSNIQLAELGAAPLPDSVGPNGANYSHLVYAGADAAAFIRRDFTSNAKPAVVIVHDPAFGAPVGGTGGASGTGGGGGGSGGAGGTGGAPDPCPGCKFTTVEAYGRDMVHDPTRNLIYVASHASAPVHPSSIIVVDAATGAVLSSVPVGNDPQSLALSDDGSALWVGLLGEGRVRRLTPGATLVPGPAYSLPKLLTTGEASAPISVAVLPGHRRRSPSACKGTGSADYYGRRAVFILDDGQPRANFIQPPEVGASFLVNGPPGRLLGVGDTSNLLVFRLTAVGATLDSFGGLFGILNNTSDFIYSAGAAYASTGEVVDLTNPDAPLPAGSSRPAAVASWRSQRHPRDDAVPGLRPRRDPAHAGQHDLHPGRLAGAPQRAVRGVGDEVPLPRRRRGGVSRTLRAAADHAGADDRIAAVRPDTLYWLPCNTSGISAVYGSGAAGKSHFEIAVCRHGRIARNASGPTTFTLSTRPDGAIDARTVTLPCTRLSSRTSARW